MQKSIKKMVLVVIIGLFLCMSFGQSNQALASTGEEILVYVNDSKVSFSDDSGRPVIKDGRTFLPVRALGELIGVKVDWIPYQTVKYTDANGKIVEMYIGNKNYKVNGELYKMDVAPFIDQTAGRVFAPAKYIGEAVGYKMGYKTVDNKSFIFIFTPNQTPVQMDNIMQSEIDKLKTVQ